MKTAHDYLRAIIGPEPTNILSYADAVKAVQAVINHYDPPLPRVFPPACPRCLQRGAECLCPPLFPATPPKPKPAVPTKEALAALFWGKYRGQLNRKDEPLEADDIRDIMALDGENELQVQVHMRGFTDWYSVKRDASGNLDPATIEQLPF
jgi:hypothetical protein